MLRSFAILLLLTTLCWAPSALAGPENPDRPLLGVQRWDMYSGKGPTQAQELRNNLDAHMASSIPEAREVNFVWALYGHEAIHYTRSKVALMMDDTIAHMTKPNWQTVMDGRPLLPVLWPDNFKQQLAAPPKATKA